MEFRTYFLYFHTFSYKFKVQRTPTEFGPPVTRSKLRALSVLVLFSSGVFWKQDTMSVSKSFPSFLRWSLWKKKTAKGEEPFQGKFVVIVEGSLPADVLWGSFVTHSVTNEPQRTSAGRLYSLVNLFWENLSNFCQFILSLVVICLKIFKHWL